MKKFLLASLIVIGVLLIGQLAHADTSTLLVSPATSSATVGVPFKVSVQANAAGNKVCVVSGTLVFKNLSCQNITIANGLIAVTAPSCGSPSFTIGIPKCTTNVQNLISLSVYGNGVGQATLSIAGAKVIGASTDVVFTSQAGTYNIVAATPGTKPTKPVVTSPSTTNNPVPTITAVYPNLKTVGDSDFVLTIEGTNFVENSFVSFAGLTRETTYVSSTKITAKIIAFDLSAPGTFSVTVSNPLPGGGTSNIAEFRVNNKQVVVVGQQKSSSFFNFTLTQKDILIICFVVIFILLVVILIIGIYILQLKRNTF